MSYLSVAQAAISASSAAMEHLGTTPHAKETSSQQRHPLWNYWPLAACAIPAIILVVTAVAAAVFQNFALAIAQGLCLAALGLLSFHVYNTLHLQELEDYVTEFAVRTQILANTALQLSDTNKKLESTAQQLHTQLETREKDFASERQTATDAMHKLEAVTAQLAKSEAAVEQMKSIVSGSHEVMSEMSTKMQGFIHLNQRVETSSKQLTTQIKELQSMQERFSSSIHLLDSESEELSSYKKKADEIAQNLFAQFMQIATLLAAFKEKEELLQSGLASLKQVDSDLAIHRQALHGDVHDMDEQIQRARMVANQAQEFTKILERIAFHLDKKQP